MARDYTLRRSEDVYDFLKKEPSAIALVSEAHGRIREHFPQSDAVRKLDAFDDRWWLGASSSSPADICIKVEYR